MVTLERFINKHLFYNMIKMSKLTIVKQSLEKNLQLGIVEVFEYNSLPHIVGSWCHTVDFLVAPKRQKRS